MTVNQNTISGTQEIGSVILFHGSGTGLDDKKQIGIQIGTLIHMRLSGLQGTGLLQIKKVFLRKEGRGIQNSF